MSGSRISRHIVAIVLFSTGTLYAARPPQAKEQQEYPEVLTRVPIHDRGLQVKINGQGPFLLGFDTGASGKAWLSEDLAERCGASAEAHVAVKASLNAGLAEQLNLPVLVRAGSAARPLDVVCVGEVELGDVVFRNVLAFVHPLPATGGNLGFEFFNDYLLTLDWAGGELRLARGELPDPDGKQILPFTYERNIPEIEIDIASLRLTAALDSGGAGEIILPPALAEKLPLVNPPEAAGTIENLFGDSWELLRARLDGTVRIGAFVFENPVLLFSEWPEGVNIGREILNGFVLTFDQKNRRVRLERVKPQGTGGGVQK